MTKKAKKAAARKAMPRTCLVGLAYLFGAIVSQQLGPITPRVAVSDELSADDAMAVVEQESVPVTAVISVTGVKRTLASQVATASTRSALEEDVVTVACNDGPSVHQDRGVRPRTADAVRGEAHRPAGVSAEKATDRQPEESAQATTVGDGSFGLDVSDLGPILPGFESAVPAQFSPIAGAVTEHVDADSLKTHFLDTPLFASASSRVPEAAEVASALPETSIPLETSQVVSPADAPTSNAKENIEPLTPELVLLRKRVQAALDLYRHRTLNTRDNGAWSIMHSFISYGVDKQLRVGGPTGRPVNAIGWICFNYPCRGERLFHVAGEHIQGRRGPGFQGHEGQFLSMLAQSRVRIDYPMKVGKRDFTVADLVEREKLTCRAGTELTFKLIGLSHYLDTDETWKSERGDKWDIPRLIQEELGQPIVGAACGGTHRLFGLSYAVNRRERTGKSIEGQYRRAKIYIKDYQDYTFKLQNPDGSFSTEFFAGRGAQYDPARRLLTTGHVAEWLAFSLPAEELRRPEMVRAMNFLTKMLIDGRRREMKVGPQGHALHALALYNDRAWDADSNVVGTKSLTSID